MNNPKKTTFMASDHIPTDPVARFHWVKMQLGLVHSSFNEIARETGYSKTLIRNCLYQPSRFAEKALARKINLTEQELFPERFDENGNRLHLCRPSNRSIYKKRRNDQNTVDV